MAKFTAIICNNIENMPANVSETTHVRVRIPQFHGNKDNTDDKVYFADNQLPWARMPNATGDASFVATGYYEDGTIVTVDILNNDLTNIIVGSVVSNYLYTTDATEIAARTAAMSGSTNVTSAVDYTTETSISIADSITKKALEEANTKPLIHDKGNNNIKYNDWYYDYDNAFGEDKPWYCVFVCWVFDQCGLKQYFYGGQKTISGNTLYNYHKGKGEAVSGTYKKGDLIFMNLDGGTDIKHVEIAVSDWDDKTKTIECVGGGIYHKLDDGTIVGKVSKETRKQSQIVAAVRPGTAIYTNRNDPKWKQFDPKWKNNLLVSQTIGQVGCAMTSIAICMRMTGLTKSDFSPAVLNDYLRTHSGYTSENCIYWNAMANYIDSWKWVRTESLAGSNNDKIKQIKQLLNDGYYLVIAVKNEGHWVAATGYSGNKILMSDPGKSDATDLFSTYTGITKCQLYSCKNKFTMI